MGWEWSWGRPVISVGVFLLIFGGATIYWLCMRPKRKREREALERRLEEAVINKPAQSNYQDYKNNGMLPPNYGYGNSNVGYNSESNSVWVVPNNDIQEKDTSD